MKSRKTEQLSARIRNLISEILLREISDPRLGDITVNRIELASDGSYAKVFVSTYAIKDQESQDESMRALIRAAGYLRKHLSRELGTRTVPELRFVWDESVSRGEKVLSLIRSLKTENDPS